MSQIQVPDPRDQGVRVARDREAASDSAFFHLDKDRAGAQLLGGKISPVDARSSADELDGLLNEAIDSGAVSAAEPHARLYVYPLSVREAEPLLAVGLQGAPTLLGHSLQLRGRDSENPVAFSLRVLEAAAEDANALIADYRADADCLDRLAAHLNRPGPWRGADVCEYLAGELHRSGREILDNAEG
jgi:hypothetical protein